MAKMCKFWTLWCISLVLLFCETLASGLGSRNRASLWKTSHGNAPADNKGLVSLMAPQDLPLAQAPKPVLIEADVTEPPLPSGVSKASAPFDTDYELISSPPTPEPNGQPKVPAALLQASMALLLASVALLLAFPLLMIASFIFIFQRLSTL